MYARSKVEWRLKQAAKAYGGRDWEYHSIREVDSANSFLNDLYNRDTGALVRPLLEDEIRWMTNERVLCACDYDYFSSRYAFIKDWRNQIVHYQPNVAQQILNSVRAELEERDAAVDIQALKARQLGISTDTEIAVCHRVTFVEGVNAIIGSSDPDKSWKMSQMMELAWEKIPNWMLPVRTKYNAGSLIEFGRQRCVLMIQHGTQNQGIGRGDTPTVCHLSELAEYDDPEDLVDASLMRAMHESPYLFITLESTAKGRHNWWHRTWEHSKEHFFRGESRHYPLFLPWFVGRDLYPTETWIRSHPIREGWQPAGITVNHAERAKNYVRVNPLLRRFLGPDWQMPREQMWYWEVQRTEALEKKTLQNFYSEMPADDEEAFQNTNQSVFDAETISIYREATKRVPVAVYGITGSQSDVPIRLQPDRRDIDPNRAPIPLTYRSPIGVKKSFQLIPLKFEGYSRCDPHGKLLVWEHPRQGQVYGMGVDTGEGIGLDRSVVEVLRKGTAQENDAQVAELVSPYINAHDLSPICLAIGTLFWNDVGQPRAVVECMGNGETVQHNLRLYGWQNFHHWIRYDAKRVRRSEARKLGVVMVPWYRAMMMDHTIKYLRDGWCDVNSPWFVSEMADLERDESKSHLKAMYGGNDDRIMAFGNVLFSMHDMEVRGMQSLIAAQRSEGQSEDSAPEFKPEWYGQELDDEDQILSSGFQVTDEEAEWQN